MASGIDHGGFLARCRAPEHEHEALSARIEARYHRIREALPALVSVAVGLVSTDRENRVQQQHPLRGPVAEISVGWDRYSQVLVKLLKDVSERRRRGRGGLDREAQTMSLTRPVVGVLPQDHDSHRRKGGGIKRIEDLCAWRKNPVPTLLLDKEGLELRHIGRGKSVLELRQPRGLQLDRGCRHGRSLTGPIVGPPQSGEA